MKDKSEVMKNILTKEKSTKNDKSEVIKNILVKEGGNWKDFLFPLHKKVLPVIIPALALGFIFYNVMFFFVDKGFINSLKGKLFLMAVIFLYIWIVILFYVLSSLVFTVAQVYQKSQPMMERLETSNKIK